jgi:hypothetical protein
MEHTPLDSRACVGNADHSGWDLGRPHDARESVAVAPASTPAQPRSLPTPSLVALATRPPDAAHAGTASAVARPRAAGQPQPGVARPGAVTAATITAFAPL